MMSTSHFNRALLPVVICCLSILATRCEAFTVLSSYKAMRTTKNTTGSQLRMSDIPREPDSKNRNNNKKRSFEVNQQYILEYIQQNQKELVKKLPPKPEDMIVMTGDLLSIAVYGFFDHFISQDIMVASVKNANTPAKLTSLLSKTTVAAQTDMNSDYLLSTPVWVDSTTAPNLHQILQTTVSDQIVTHYSPLLQQTGLAVTVLATCWLISGWIHESFSFRNTLLCQADTALAVTARTWLTCTVMLFTLTALSHYICGCENILSFTRGDVDYIVDSLSVLTMWRFMVSYILGSGGSK